MPTHFDSESEDAKLALLREKEEEDLARILSEKYALEYADLSLTPISTEALRLIPEDTAKEAGAAAYALSGKKISVAVHNPQNPKLEEVVTSLKERGYTAQKYMVSPRSLARIMARYQDLSYAHVSTAGVFDLTAEDMGKLAAELHTHTGLKDYLDAVLAAKNAGQVSRILEDIVVAALSMNASDIHLEPEEHQVRLRFRLDGLLEDMYMLDAKTYQRINSRVKLLSGLKLNVENRAQDGRFTIAVKDTEIEIR
ncbi:MAG: ATPase, T2SS/T4P/T4SS family, partial [Minisyncoccia bacterium]